MPEFERRERIRKVLKCSKMDAWNYYVRLESILTRIDKLDHALAARLDSAAEKRDMTLVQLLNAALDTFDATNNGEDF